LGVVLPTLLHTEILFVNQLRISGKNKTTTSASDNPPQELSWLAFLLILGQNLESIVYHLIKNRTNLWKQFSNNYLLVAFYLCQKKRGCL